MKGKETSRWTRFATWPRRKCIPNRLVIAALLLLSTPGKVFAQTDAVDSLDGSGYGQKHARTYLFGDWAGERSNLAGHGVVFDFFYVADLQANPVGGLEQAQAGWGRIRGTVDVDFGKLAEWNGLTFHATGLWQFGGNLGADIGALANPSGLVSAHTTRLDSFWLQQAFFHHRLLIRAGQLAGLDFYGNQEYGASYLIEPLDYAFGNLFTVDYESFNPAGTPGAQVQGFLYKTFYLKSAVLSGNRDPYHQDPTGFHFAIRNSPVFAFEMGFTRDAATAMDKNSLGARKTYPGIYKFGATYNGGKFANFAGVAGHGNYLIYGDANQALYRTDAGSTRGLDALIGFDWSPNNLNRVNSEITAGARFNGPFPSRTQDDVALAFVWTKIGDPFQRIGVPAGFPALGSEKAIELNYAAQVTPYILFQPVFQYYVDVGANSRIPNAAVFGFRTKINF
jgi:carbohydrate-selective porin OprB